MKVVGLLLANQDTELTQKESQREESGESQFLGSLWRATLSRKAWMPIWGLSTVYRAPCGGGRGKEEPLSAIATVLHAAPGDDGLPPPGPPRHTSAA